MDTLRSIDVSDYSGVTFRDQVGPAPLLQWIELDSLAIDDSYQRTISLHGRKQVRAIAEHFRWTHFATVIVAPVEGGRFAIIDGQHRCHAARLRGIKSVPCMVVQADATEQARAFSAVNMQQTAVRPPAMHKARLAAGDATAIRLNAICEAAGVRIVDNTPASRMRRGDTVAVMALYNMERIYDPEGVVAGLKAIIDAGDGNIGMLKVEPISAYCDVFSRRRDLRAHADVIDALDDFDLSAAFARMLTTARDPGTHRWRILATELESWLDQRLSKVAA
ncbi:ParB-like nuclease [Bosea sp. LC85]|uniref:DUF6551 family protein n=1 Tax=Bosea sp. LC85 TaxID=1502851 RepID=UPI0004E28FFA|nr:DUF6551 family protein [Bosea sp. LC85]KFC73226.1 ParB-like nuclease [Bosea sp. LC85]